MPRVTTFHRIKQAQRDYKRARSLDRFPEPVKEHLLSLARQRDRKGFCQMLLTEGAPESLVPALQADAERRLKLQEESDGD